MDGQTEGHRPRAKVRLDGQGRLIPTPGRGSRMLGVRQTDRARALAG